MEAVGSNLVCLAASDRNSQLPGTNSNEDFMELDFPAMDQYIPDVVLAEIASKLPPIDFARFRRVSRNCYHACESRTNIVNKFEFECTKNTDVSLKNKATPEERQYFLTSNGEVVLPKSYEDGMREPTLKTFSVERGVRHFFHRIINKRPQHVLFNITQKYIGTDICQRVYNEIGRLAQEGPVVNLRKFTLYVDSVEKYHLLTSMFVAAEYEIHGCTTNELLLEDVGSNIRNCPLNLQIDQFSVDIRQLSAKHLYLWDVTLELDDFVDYLRNRTKMKSGLVMQFNIYHDKDEDLQKIVETERKRLNPVGTPLLEYTVFLAKPKNSIVQYNGRWLTTIQFRWHVINTKAPWLSSRQGHNI